MKKTSPLCRALVFCVLLFSTKHNAQQLPLAWPPVTMQLGEVDDNPDDDTYIDFTFSGMHVDAAGVVSLIGAYWPDSSIETSRMRLGAILTNGTIYLSMQNPVQLDEEAEGPKIAGDGLGNVYATGVSSSGAFVLRKYGTQTWSASNSSVSSPYEPVFIETDNSGNIIIATTDLVDTSTEFQDYFFIAKYSPGGSKIWEERRNSTPKFTLLDFKQDKIGRFRCLGYWASQFVAITLDSNGRAGGGGGGGAGGLTLALTNKNYFKTMLKIGPSNEVIIAGQKDGVVDFYKISENGTEAWRFSYPLGGFTDFAIGSDGNFAVAGVQSSPVPSLNPILYFEGRNLRWRSQLAGFSSTSQATSLHFRGTDLYAAISHGGDSSVAKFSPQGVRTLTSTVPDIIEPKIAPPPAPPFLIAGQTFYYDGPDEFRVGDIKIVQFVETNHFNAPTIISIPDSVRLYPGASANLTVGVGPQPASYYWYRNRVYLAGQTSLTLSLNNVSPLDDGFYCLVASNSFGTAVSPDIRVEVNAPTIIGITGPSTPLALGTDAYFSAKAGGIEPLSFQWLRDNAPIPGANSAELILKDVTVPGQVRLVVTNIFGEAVSSNIQFQISPIARANWSADLSKLASVNSIARDSSGNISLLGNIAGKPYLEIQSYFPAGIFRWSYTWTNSNGARPSPDRDLRVAQDGSAFVIARYGSQGDVAILKLSSNGAKLWETVMPTVTPSLSLFEFPQIGALGITPDGGTVFSVNEDSHAYVAKLDLNGNFSWASALPAMPDRILGDIIAHGSQIYISETGDFTSALGISRLHNLSASGEILWTREFDRFGGFSFYNTTAGTLAVGAGKVFSIESDGAMRPLFSGGSPQIAVDPTGFIYQLVSQITSTSPFTLSYFVERIDPFGKSVWKTPIPALVSVTGLALGNNGGALVSGSHARGLLTAKVTADGKLPWIAHETSPTRVSGPANLVTDNQGDAIVRASQLGLFAYTDAQSNLPQFILQPQSMEERIGQPIVLMASATSASPITFQWTRNGQPIPGATSSNLINNAVTPDLTGYYILIASNQHGATLSQAASVQIGRPPQISGIIVPNLFVPNEPLLFDPIDLLTGSMPMSFQWYINGLAVPGQTNRTLQITNTSLFTPSFYSLLASNRFGSTLANIWEIQNWPLENPAPLVRIIAPKQNSQFKSGDSITFQAEAGDYLGVVQSVEFRINNVPIATDLNRPFQASWTLTVPGSYTIVAAARDGEGQIGLSPEIHFDILESQISIGAFPSQTITLGEEIRLEPTYNAPESSSFQWLKNGLRISGATDADFFIDSASLADSGNYSLIIETAVGSFSSATIPVTVQSPAATMADVFANAPAQSTDEGASIASNTEATTEPGEPSHGGQPSGNSLWLTYTAPGFGTLTFDTRGSDFDTLLGVYIGNSVNALTVVDGDDDRGGYLNSLVKISVQPGIAYRVAVSGFAGATGRVVLNWNFEPASQFAPRIRRHPRTQVALLGENVTFSVDASSDSPATYHWFRDGLPLAVPSSPALTINNVSKKNVGDYVVLISNSSGSIVSLSADLQILEGSTASNNKFPAIDKLGQSVTGEIVQDINRARFGSAPPARGYVGDPRTLTYSGYQNSRDRGEPQHCGIAGGSSSVYRLIADQSGSMLVSTEGSDFDTILAIYQGPPNALTWSQLQSVDCDDNSGADHRDSRLVFQAQAGQMYYIVVDGVGGAAGRVQLFYVLSPLPQILQSPQSRTVLAGDNLTLTVTAPIVPLWNFQWRLNGVDIPNETNPTLQISNIQRSHEGRYSCYLWNFAGSDLSTEANIIVNDTLPFSFTAITKSQTAIQFNVPSHSAQIIIEASSDLANWLPIFTNPNPTVPFPFSESILSNTNRFYRAKRD